jgi:aldose 1-epimerase
MTNPVIRPFGTLESGEEVQAITLVDSRGHEAIVLTLGATLQALWTPDARGNRTDIVLGHDDPAAYLKHSHYFGASVGRHANRIAQGRFRLEGRQYQVERNNGNNHLHGGGATAFHRRLWQIQDASNDSVTLALRSDAGDGGYPGRLDVTARYALDAGGGLAIEYGATTDAPTIVNLTNHSYFNLSGGGDVMGHRLTLDASRYAPVNAQLIPTGELPDVTGTPFDFRSGVAVGERIRDPHEQLRFGRGYDHHLVIDGPPGTLRRAARLEDPRSGRVLELHITAPGVQFYSGNFLDGTTLGKGGLAYRQGDGLCLEPQGFPDAPNQPSFPSTLLMPGETYASAMLLRFGAR